METKIITEDEIITEEGIIIKLFDKYNRELLEPALPYVRKNKNSLINKQRPPLDEETKKLMSEYRITKQKEREEIISRQTQNIQDFLNNFNTQ